MNKNIKVITFILLIMFFIIIFLFGIFGISLSFLSSEAIKETRKLNKDLITTLKINNIESIYDKNNNIYYYMVSEEFENNMYVLNLEVDKGLKYKLVGETLNVINVDYDKQIKVIIYNDEYYYETKIQLTNLPLISIETEEEISTNGNDINSNFKYINLENISNTIEYNIKIRVRGATSRYLPKKSYKINFYNKEYKDEKKVKISDFYYGDSFILDGLYRDNSKIRNVFATELWNNISNDFSEVNINSEFVELFINNEYMGLYLFTEPINRTKLNLNKTNEYDTSFIVKSTTNVGYEVKYPNDEDLIPEVIDNLENIISEYFITRSYSSFETITNSWDLKNYLDIIIFNYFINNIDNRLEQNVYYYANSKYSDIIYIQPWDMEFSLGIYPTTEGIKKIEASRFDCYLFHENAPEINKLLIERYWELRKSVLTKEYLDNLLDAYKNKLNKGAILRDSNTWNEYDFVEEIEFIRSWLYERLEYSDKYIKELENE